MSPLARPLLVFDGDCGFCRSWVARWRRAIDGHVDVAPYQAVAAEHPEVPAERFAESVVLLEPDGRTFFAAAAVFRALSHAPRRGLAWWAYSHVPGFAALSETFYRLVARNRDRATAVTRLLWGEHVVPPGERLTSWVFVRLVGAVFLMAFVSLAVQVEGLVGHAGILPAADWLAALATRYGAVRFYLLPTLAWLNASDGFLMGLCIAGVLASLLVVAGVAPRAMLLVAWATYLSLSSIGGNFLWFQWDGLLLEAAIIAALLSPWTWRWNPGDAWRPARAAVWLSRWLVFRLMFSSAVVKLTSGDPSWRHLTALRFHYETQPLPPWTAWYAHHLPAGFQSFSAAAMFAIEGLAPFLFFAPRRARMAGAAAIASLQVLILVTGNYGFFNWLALALCVMLLDDAVWPRWLRRLAGLETTAAGASAASGRRRLATGIAVALGVLGLYPMLATLRVPDAWMGPLPAVYQAVLPFRTINAYGLFAVMTTHRDEIIVEGSRDGEHWRPYRFRYKPGDPTRRPAFVPGHMPRLDWQMWFAALQPGRPAYWFLRFARQLLAGSKPVLGLLAGDPFPDRPPEYLRAMLYRYRFSDAETRRRTGAWWVREREGVYLPPVRLEDGNLVPVAGLEPGP